MIIAFVFYFFLYLYLSVNILGYVIFLSFYPRKRMYYIYVKTIIWILQKFSIEIENFPFINFFKICSKVCSNSFEFLKQCLMIYGFFIYHFDFQYFRNSIPFLFIEFVIEFYFGIFNDLLIHIVNYYIFNLQLLSSILFNFSLCSI